MIEIGIKDIINIKQIWGEIANRKWRLKTSLRYVNSIALFCYAVFRTNIFLYIKKFSFWLRIFLT